jgi:hypothetical protein
LGAVDHACNSSYSRVRDWEDRGLKIAQTKSENYISTNKLGGVDHNTNPSYVGGLARKITVEVSPSLQQKL